MSTPEWREWEPRFAQFLEHSAGSFDAAHDMEHIRRVVANTRSLAHHEHADEAVVIPAAWLHDCVIVPKNSPLRSRASVLAGRAAVEFLSDAGYPATYLPDIRHAIEAHSFSAGIAPRTLAARVVQDADRLDALGAVGLARCLMLSGATGRRLYDPAEPLPRSRVPDDLLNAVDHLYTKLFRLAEQMNTSAGRAEAEQRTAFLRAFVEQLDAELHGALA